MVSTSTQTATVPERKPDEMSQPRPVTVPADKPFTIKLQGQIPA